MKHVQLLDCTLRDGAYIVDKKFGDNTILGISQGLQKSCLDFIEMGFFQSEGFGEGKTVFRNSADAKRFIPKNKNGVKYTVLADYSRYSINELDLCDGSSIDAVRACFFKHERFDVLDFCREIKNKGYLLFVQPVDILGYRDADIIDFIEKINEIEPYCISIVDTFGSMYLEDLQRVFSLFDHNLSPDIRIGFHSHNNMQMSNALSQEFIRISLGKREVVIDGTLCGMGRGAGNTPTELIAQYLIQKWHYNYNLDAILDVIDNYMDYLKTRCTWGYSTAYFIAGCYSAHVNNIAYLLQKNSIQSKDIRYILNAIGANARKRYDYDLLDKTYLSYLDAEIDDSSSRERLRSMIRGKNVIIILPGNSVIENTDLINKAINEKSAVVISVNYIPDAIKVDLTYFSNKRRFDYWNKDGSLIEEKLILTSNIKEGKGNYIINFTSLIKCGWEHMDSSVILLLRLLDDMDVESIGLAGFDGYNSSGERNYVLPEMERTESRINSSELNKELKEMLEDYINNRKKQCEVYFITQSRFESVLKK